MKSISSDGHPRTPTATPVPWRRVLTIGAVLLANHFSLLLVIPLMPFMVAHFFPAFPKAQLGYWTGYLTTAFFLGQLIAGYTWGWAADRYGRRPVLMIGLLGTFTSVILFGLSSSYSYALVVRFLWGLSNGNIPVCKAYLSDFLDPTNNARGFSIFGLQAAVSRFLGPPIGGLLSNPEERLPALAQMVPLLSAFPYLLPCVMAGTLSLGSLLLTYFCLPESMRWSSCQNGTKELPEASSEQAALVSQHKVVDAGLSSEAKADLLVPELLISSALYAILGFCHVGFEELLPLWVLMDHTNGGFGFGAPQIGATMAFTGPVGILSQLLLVPWITTKVSCRTAFQLAMCCFSIAALVTPLWAFVSSLGHHAELLAVATAYILLSVAAEAAYTYVFILINDSVPSGARGRANGLAAVFVGLTRTIGTSMWGPFFSWSNSLPWNNHLCLQLPFAVITALGLGTALLAFFLPPAIGS